jgi:hypothetical protein
LYSGIVYLPGDPEPESLRRNAEHQRILAELKAEARAARILRREPEGLRRKLRFSFGRD